MSWTGWDGRGRMKNLREGGAHKTLQIPSLHMQLKERGEREAELHLSCEKTNKPSVLQH